jgi:choline-sulfatase
MVADALMQGRYTPWDYQPFRDASRRFMRNHLDLNELEETSRFPRPSQPTRRLES